MHSKTSRRTFVKGLAAGGILGGLGLWRTPVWAVTSPGLPSVLTGNQFDLFIGEQWKKLKSQIPYVAFDLESDGDTIKEFAFRKNKRSKRG